MAVFYNFTIECDGETEAMRIQQTFTGLEIRVNGLEVTMSKEWIVPRNGFWYFSLSPAGVMHNGPVYMDALNSGAVIAMIRESFYQRLQRCDGFRRAWVGCEGYELLAHWDSPGDGDRVDVTDMIIREALVRDDKGRLGMVAFSKGYLRVL